MYEDICVLVSRFSFFWNEPLTVSSLNARQISFAVFCVIRRWSNVAWVACVSQTPVTLRRFLN